MVAPALVALEIIASGAPLDQADYANVPTSASNESSGNDLPKDSKLALGTN